MNEEQIRSLRTWRTTAIAITIIEAVLLIAHSLTAAASWPGTLVLGIITLAWLAVAIRNTWKIRAGKAVQSRVDWQWVRIMEHEVYGRIFHHDGAPGISGTPARRDSDRDPRGVWCDCHGTIPGHIRAPRHYDPRYGYPDLT